MNVTARRTVKWIVAAAGLGGVAGGLFLAMRPAPIDVDVRVIDRGPVVATIDEQAETRSHDRFSVAAPVAGRILRVVLHEGDPVLAGQPVADLLPMPVGEREARELEARLASARALQREAEERVRGAEQTLALASRERARLQGLAAQHLVADAALDQVRTAEEAARYEVSAARHRVAAAAGDVAAVRASLVAARAGSTGDAPTLVVRSPVAGRVLRIIEKSDRVVPAGTPLLMVGDLAHLEVLIQMLSTEAVRVRPGMAVLLDGWGGDRVLHARVSLVEPYAFTKVSALGVEEKRTNVIADFVESPGPLGDGYRLDAHVVTYAAESVLRAPASAVFGCGAVSCVYAVEGGRARRTEITVGHRGADAVEVVGGLRAGMRVVSYPSNDVADGIRVRTPP